MYLGKWIFGVSQQIPGIVNMQEAHWPLCDLTACKVGLVRECLNLPLWRL